MTRVLLVRRDARPDDDHYGKVNGLGGKLEAGEHVVAVHAPRAAARRPDVEVTSLRLRGTITWTDFGPRDENWLGFVFLADAWKRCSPRRATTKGSLIWVSRPPPARRLRSLTPRLRRQAADLVLWDGDRHFLPLVFDDDPRPFHGDHALRG